MVSTFRKDKLSLQRDISSKIDKMMFYEDSCWSALATAPAETSAEAKEAFNFNKIFFHLVPFHLEGAKLRIWNFACGPE